MRTLLLICIGLIASMMYSMSAFADSNMGSQIVNIDTMTISTFTDSNIVLSITGTSQISGQCAMRLYSPNLENDTTIELYMTSGISDTLTFTLALLKGASFMDVTFSIIDSATKSNFKDSLYEWETARTLFFRIDSNAVGYVGYEPDSNDVKMPTWTKGDAIPTLLGTSLLGSKRQKDAKALTQMISVSITGRVAYSVKNVVTDGVPVRVWLDWDSDNKTTTGYTPYRNIDSDPDYRHIGWDDADMNGNFSFNFEFPSDIPANEISNSIRFVVGNKNDYLVLYNHYDGDLLPSNSSVSIEQSTYTVNITDYTVGVDIDRGSAIRYLTRAAIFASTKMDLPDIPAVTYRVKSDGDIISRYNPNGIIFMGHRSRNNVAAIYHEYGHFVHDLSDEHYFDYFTNEYDDPHKGNFYFTLESGITQAFIEGWAYFFAAACLDYWYAKEMSSSVVSTYGTYPPVCYPQNSNDYQFLDYGQQLICDLDRRKVEGAVASFFYSLYDGYGLRGPNYEGDNDDMSFDGAFLRGNLEAARVYAYQWDCSYVEGFKNALLGHFSEYQYNEKVSSLNALYSTLILNSGVAHSATPTILTAIGTLSLRTLNWNDNTCPVTKSFGVLGGTGVTYPFFQNQESGFYICRKQVTSTDWDGTLAGFTLIKTVGQNITATTDDEVLSAGSYRYVVVAYNSSGVSIPKATTIVDCTTLSTPTNEDLSDIVIDIDRNVPASGTITMENVEVTGETKIELCAGSTIILKPGVKIPVGAQIHSHIESCTGCSLTTEMPKRAPSEETISDNSTNLIPINTLSPQKGGIQMQLYPQPADDYLIIKIISESGEPTISLTTLVGATLPVKLDREPSSPNVWQWRFSTKDLSAGVYSINVNTGSNNSVSQLITIVR